MEITGGSAGAPKGVLDFTALPEPEPPADNDFGDFAVADGEPTAGEEKDDDQFQADNDFGDFNQADEITSATQDANAADDFGDFAAPNEDTPASNVEAAEDEWGGFDEPEAGGTKKTVLTEDSKPGSANEENWGYPERGAMEYAAGTVSWNPSEAEEGSGAQPPTGEVKKDPLPERMDSQNPFGVGSSEEATESEDDDGSDPFGALVMQKGKKPKPEDHEEDEKADTFLAMGGPEDTGAAVDKHAKSAVEQDILGSLLNMDPPKEENSDPSKDKKPSTNAPAPMMNLFEDFLSVGKSTATNSAPPEEASELPDLLSFAPAGTPAPKNPAGTPAGSPGDPNSTGTTSPDRLGSLGDLKETLRELIKSERFDEALRCKKHIQADAEIKQLLAEKKALKQEIDRAEEEDDEEAAAKLVDLKKNRRPQEEIDQWCDPNRSSEYPMYRDMRHLEKFVEEFPIPFTKIAFEDLEQALNLQERAAKFVENLNKERSNPHQTGSKTWSDRQLMDALNYSVETMSQFGKAAREIADALQGKELQSFAGPGEIEKFYMHLRSCAILLEMCIMLADAFPNKTQVDRVTEKVEKMWKSAKGVVGKIRGVKVPKESKHSQTALFTLVSEITK